MIKLLIVTLILYVASAQPCLETKTFQPSTSMLPNFQAGTIQLVMDPTPKERALVYINKLKNNFDTKNADVGIFISLMQGFREFKNLDFSIKGKISGLQSLNLILFTDQNFKWAYISTHFIVSARDDLRTQSISLNPQLILGPNVNKRQINFQYYFGSKREWNPQARGKVRAYLTGIKYKGDTLNLKINQASLIFEKSVIQLSLSIESQMNFMEELQVTYIIYTPFNSLIVFKDLKLSNLGQSFQKILSSTLANNEPNRIFGLIGLNLEVPLNKTQRRRLLQSEGEKIKPNSYSNFLQIQGLQFQINSNKLSRIFQLFIETAGTIVSNQSCSNFQECIGSNGQIINEVNNSRCIICQPNSFYNFISRKCQCKRKYYRNKNNNCINIESLCKQNEVYFNGRCYQISSPAQPNCGVDEVFNKTTSSCQCIQGYSFDYSSGKRTCVLFCGINQSFDPKTKRCFCDGYVIKTNICIMCRQKYSNWNQQLKQCICKEGFAKKGYQCDKCGEFAAYDKESKLCKCQVGYMGDGFVCNQIPVQNFAALYAEFRKKNPL